MSTDRNALEALGVSIVNIVRHDADESDVTFSLSIKYGSRAAYLTDLTAKQVLSYPTIRAKAFESGVVLPYVAAATAGVAWDGLVREAVERTEASPVVAEVVRGS